MKKLMSFVLLLSLVVSCASKKATEREIDEKAAKTNVTDPQALGNTIHDLIQNSETLKPEQKTELTNIIEANRQLAMKLSEESYRYRAVLIQELLSGKVEQKRIKIIKKDIKRIEAARMKNTFDTVHKISKIVSKIPDREKFAEELIKLEARPLR